MKILITGGGLAGLTLAYWLEQYGFTPVIWEKSAGLRREGYGIDFFGSGYDVAERMGLLDALERQQINAQYVGYVDENGKVVASLAMSLMQKIMDGRYLALMHQTLEEELHSTIADTVEIRFAESIASIEQTDEHVFVRSNSGTSAYFDLVIGADGIHSQTRELVFGPESEFNRYLGYYVASFKLKDLYDIGNTWKNYSEPGRQVGAYCSNRDGEIITLFMWEAPYEGHIPREERYDHLCKAFTGMDWIAKDLLAHAPSANIFTDSVTQITMDEWHKGRVALVGDACGCMTLISGQGASMALGGAFILAEALRDYSDYSTAFRVYQNQVLPEIRMRQSKARDFAKSFVPGSELGLQVQRVMMKIFLRDAFKGVLRKQFGGESILRRALKRIPQNRSDILGYVVSGKLRDVDYQSLSMDMDDALREHDQIHLLLNIEHIKGIEPSALWDDVKFGKKYGRHIAKLAVVGDKKWHVLLAAASRPFYAEQSRHFSANKLDDGWRWLHSS